MIFWRFVKMKIERMIKKKKRRKNIYNISLNFEKPILSIQNIRDNHPKKNMS